MLLLEVEVVVQADELGGQLVRVGVGVAKPEVDRGGRRTLPETAVIEAPWLSNLLAAADKWRARRLNDSRFSHRRHGDLVPPQAGDEEHVPRLHAHLFIPPAHGVPPNHPVFSSQLPRDKHSAGAPWVRAAVINNGTSAAACMPHPVMSWHGIFKSGTPPCPAPCSAAPTSAAGTRRSPRRRPPGHGRCVSICFDKNRRHIGKVSVTTTAKKDATAAAPRRRRPSRWSTRTRTRRAHRRAAWGRAARCRPAGSG
jgi:hypothetical protein